MIVSIHQPAYLPWLGYFHKILHSDVFVFLDTVQMEKNGYVNRNRVRTASGVQWLTVPLLMKGHMDKPISEMQINQADRWKRKHLGTMEQAYGKRAHYGAYAEGVHRLVESSDESLCDLLFDMLGYFLEVTGIHGKQIVRASTLNLDGQRSELLLNICQEVGGDTYLSGIAGKEYLDLTPFNNSGVDVVFQEFEHPEYDQGYPDFAPNMGIVDALFNCGGETVASMLRSIRV